LLNLVDSGHPLCAFGLQDVASSDEVRGPSLDVSLDEQVRLGDDALVLRFAQPQHFAFGEQARVNRSRDVKERLVHRCIRVRHEEHRPSRACELLTERPDGLRLARAGRTLDERGVTAKAAGDGGFLLRVEPFETQALKWLARHGRGPEQPVARGCRPAFDCDLLDAKDERP
jgi:hypothetical protein